MNPTDQQRHGALEDWKRIEWIITATGRSVNSFALHIGLKRGENLYRIRRGSNRLSIKLAECIHRHYPMVSLPWILTGAEPRQNIGFRLGSQDSSSISTSLHASQLPLKLPSGKLLRIPTAKRMS